MMLLNDKIKDAIIEDVSATQLKRLAIDEGMRTLRMVGVEKITQGLTTVEEILSVTMADKK